MAVNVAITAVINARIPAIPGGIAVINLFAVIVAAIFT